MYGLRELIHSGSPARILDVRWRLERPDGREAFSEGHIPGAVFVDLPTELAEPGRPATEGRLPLPSRNRLQEAVRRWGVRDGETVIVYDDIKNLSSARAWWVLRDAGVADVRVLDGELRAWIDAGLPLETSAPAEAAVPGDIVLDDAHRLPVLDIAEAAAFPDSGTLLDARAAGRYRGEGDPIDPRSGHIPGALSAPTTGNVDDAGRFLSPALLRERFTELGVSSQRPVASYCGSGVTAAHNSLALTLAGFEPALFVGSWSAWAQHPYLPVATGPDPR